MTSPSAHRVHAAWRFLRLGLSDFDKTASLLPSSRFLVDAMLRPVPLERARCVIELGAGTGTLTQKIIQRLPKDGHLHAIELDAKLLDAATRRVRDPRLHPVHGNAVDLLELLGHTCSPGSTDAVLSSLGLSLMDNTSRDAILKRTAQMLHPTGVFTQYAYLHARWFAYSQGRRQWFRWHARPYLESIFSEVTSTFVPVNVPPAVVYTCRIPRSAAKSS